MLASAAMRNLSILFTAVLTACGEQRPTPESTGPIVGALELPISLRRVSSAPTDAAHIEVAPGELRLENQKVIDLAQGHVPGAERTSGTITKLQSALRSGPARSIATLRIHVNVPYETTQLILTTLASTGMRRVAFEAREPATPNVGWLVLEQFEVAATSDDPHTFEGASQRTWDEFTAGWQQTFDACRRAHYVDCAFVPNTIAQGGQTNILLFMRGSALKVELTRFGAPEAEPERSRAVAMLPGLPQPPSEQPAQVEEPPATDATFTWRFDAAVTEPSPISAALRPLCGAQPCGISIRADKETLTMRMISFLGAAFPTGAPPPHVIFQAAP